MEFDPSKLPLKGTKSNLISQNIAQTDKQTITPLTELKLSLNKEYPAEVVKQQANSQTNERPQAKTQNQSTPDKTSQHQTKQSSVELTSKADVKTDQGAIKNQQANTWILKVNDKFIEVKTRLALENLQKINIQLSKDTNGKLSLQASNTVQTQTIQSSRTAGPNAVSNQPLSQNPSPLVLSAVLVKNLTGLLSDQISLQTGFNLIGKNLAGESKTTGDQNQIVQTAIRQLRNSLIHANNLANKSQINNESSSSRVNTRSSTQLSPQAQTIKQALLSSGLFFEKANQNKAGTLLANLANAVQKLNAQYASLTSPSSQNVTPPTTLKQNSLAQTYTATNPLTSSNHSEQNIQGQATSESTTKIKADQFQAMLTMLNKLQSLISSQDVKGGSLNSPFSNDTSNPLDLKLNLLRAIIVLNHNQGTQTKEANSVHINTTNLFDNLLATSPFDFPKIQSEAKSKVNAILADKELSTGQLLKLMAAMLTRIQFNQLNSIYQSQQNEAPGSQSLFFEVPIANSQGNTDVFSLRIDQKPEEENTQGSSEKKSEIQWKIGLTFDLEGLGPLYIQVLLTPPSISSIIWAERPSTYSLIQKESQSLKNQLSEIGLDVGDINCRQGLPEESNTSIKQNLVDIEA